jgi:DNA-binding GntR family transcriptional regulator
MLPWLDESHSRLLADVRETSLAKIVREEVLAMIIGGELAPGMRINEPDIALRLGVSRVPVREGLRELESSGLVEARKHSGVFVRIHDAKEIDDLYDLRALLDGHAGGLVARQAVRERKALAQQLAGHLATMKSAAAAKDTQTYYGANLEFHWAMVEAAGNAALAKTYRSIVQQLHVSRLRNLSDLPGMRASITEHRAIHAALVAGNAQQLQALLVTHVNDAHARLRARRETATPSGYPSERASRRLA